MSLSGRQLEARFLRAIPLVVELVSTRSSMMGHQRQYSLSKVKDHGVKPSTLSRQEASHTTSCTSVRCKKILRRVTGHQGQLFSLRTNGRSSQRLSISMTKKLPIILVKNYSSRTCFSCFNVKLARVAVCDRFACVILHQQCCLVLVLVQSSVQHLTSFDFPRHDLRRRLVTHVASRGPSPFLFGALPL